MLSEFCHRKHLDKRHIVSTHRIRITYYNSIRSLMVRTTISFSRVGINYYLCTYVVNKLS